MDEKILAEEQKQLENIQKIISGEIQEIDKLIESRGVTLQNLIEYAQSNELDKYELADAYGEINKQDMSISDVVRERQMYNRILPKPFFAKISFKEEGEAPETYYVGLKGIMSNGENVVIDWRVPMASLLYFSSLGQTSFEAPLGKVDVDLLLKRQFRLEPNKIVWYVDTNTKIDDNFLQEILSQNTSSYMSNIVQTIQEEQNRIIRKSANQSVIINGIAGSGKTSIAMHRISYILYCNRGKIASKNVLVVSPNRLFSSYIGELLPELGEENVRSAPMMQVLVDANLSPKSFGTKISMVDSQFEDKERKKQIDTKFSVKFFDEVENYLQNFDLSPYIAEAFEQTESGISLDLIRTIKTRPTADLKTKVEQLVYNSLVTRYPKFPEKMITKYKNNAMTALKNILTTEAIMDKLYQAKGLSYGEEKYGYEDAPIYAYINSKLKGVQPNYFIKHIFVDEMQDYDPFSIYLLKQIFPDSVMTLAGDYNQNILSNQSNLEMLKRILPRVEVDKLDVSYRSTQEIVDFSQNIVGGKIDSRLVRHGDKPKILKCGDNQTFVTQVQKIVSAHPNDKIAIIAKSMTEAFKLSKLLPEFSFIKDEKDDTLLTSNRIITTTYLSKGLEYDRVIISNVDDENYSNELDKQNLYVATTRALHGLYITYNGTISRFVPSLDVKKKQNVETVVEDNDVFSV